MSDRHPPAAIDPATWPELRFAGSIPNVTSPVGGLVFASNA